MASTRKTDLLNGHTEKQVYRPSGVVHRLTVDFTHSTFFKKYIIQVQKQASRAKNGHRLHTSRLL